MIFYFVRWIESIVGHPLPAVFLYTSTRMILAAITALLVSISLGPWLIRRLYLLKMGQPIRKEDSKRLFELHKKKEATPTMGGGLILASMGVALFLWMEWHSIFTLLMLLTSCVLGCVGGWDDYLKIRHKSSKGLSARAKLMVQLFLSLAIASYLFVPAVQNGLSGWFPIPSLQSQGGALSLSTYASSLYLPFFKQPILYFSGLGAVFGWLLVFFVVSGSSNAVNLTDGLDGLAAGCLLLVAASFAFIAFLANNRDLSSYLNIVYIEGSGELAIFLSAFVGGCLGFLWYNGPPAELFMGDIGSLSLGGIIGVVAVLLKRELLLALIGGIFVVEALSVILQVASYRLRNKKRVFLCAPLHHHYEFKGMPESKVVIRFWIVGLLLAALGILSLKFQ